MCFSKYKQTYVGQYGSVFHNRHMATSTKIQFLIEPNSSIDRALYLPISTRASVWSYIVANVY